MRFLIIEHSKVAYRIDFLIYGVAVVLLPVLMWLLGPETRWLEFAAYAAAGLGGWSAIEYGLHRFVLHGLQPFCLWHAEHHERPAALICTPTILSSSLIVVMVFLPAWALGDVWRASSITWGVLVGYLAYATTHHAIHHWRGKSGWMMERKRKHALHHHSAQPDHFGVTSDLWDRLMGTAFNRRPSVDAPGAASANAQANQPKTQPAQADAITNNNPGTTRKA
jgi:sterol desaturase/sphingolipid hydroxylase (fatty acid hydroxylase superfamily)